MSDMSVNYRRRKAATMAAKGTADPPTSMDYTSEAENPVGDKWGASGRQVRNYAGDKRR